MKTEIRSLDDLKFDPNNARVHGPENMTSIQASLMQFGQQEPLVIRPDGTVIGGNGRLEAMRALDWDEAHVVVFHGSEEDAAALGIALNRTGELAQWNVDQLRETLESLPAAGYEAMSDVMQFSADALAEFLDPQYVGEPTPQEIEAKYSDHPPTPMTTQFGAPPFSVLDARQGYWRNRKNEWKDLGFFSAAGREQVGAEVGTLFNSWNDGVSVMDPVVCELLYAWFCPPGGLIVNPTAGESVYGIVAGVMGYPYFGVELREEQIETNRAHAAMKSIPIRETPQWVQGNGVDVAKLAPAADFVMCCPPYYDLEVYSDLSEDLSNVATYKQFIADYRKIIAGCAEILKPNRFAAFVVGDIRDKDGNYRNFVGDTVDAFLRAGMKLYNEAILVDPAGTLPLRAGKVFKASRKLGKTHQNILVFLKGNAKKATAACGEVTRAVLEADEGEEIA